MPRCVIRRSCGEFFESYLSLADIVQLGQVVYFYFSDSPLGTSEPLWHFLHAHPNVEAAHYIQFDGTDQEPVASGLVEKMTSIYNWVPAQYFYHQRINPDQVGVELVESVSTDSVMSVSSYSADTTSEEAFYENPSKPAGAGEPTSQVSPQLDEGFPSYLERALKVYDKKQQPLHLFLKRAIAVYKNKEKLTSESTFLPSASALPAECYCITSIGK